MKKINITIIVLILLALHAFGLYYLFKPTAPPPQTQPAAGIESPTPNATETSDPFLRLLPQLNLNLELDQPLRQEPAPRTTSTTPHLNRPGTLQTNLPERRTAKNYDGLIGTPYQGAIVLDAQTGKILFEDRSDAFAYPASITKLMTFLIVQEKIDAGEIGIEDKVTITAEVLKIGGSQIWLDPRETDFTVNDLLYALMVHSANDAARALALHVTGNSEEFLSLMNRKARQLGMNATIYRSDHGLPPSDGSQPDISTPYDIALLAMAVLSHPATLHYSGTELTYLRDGNTMLSNRNALAKRVDGYSGCDGLKTGFHNRGGWSIAATAERNGQRVVAILLGCPDKNTRDSNARKLLDKGFNALSH